MMFSDVEMTFANVPQLVRLKENCDWNASQTDPPVSHLTILFRIQTGLVTPQVYSYVKKLDRSHKHIPKIIYVWNFQNKKKLKIRI